MIFLLLSIVLSSSLFLCFKWFDKKQIQLIPALSGNYLACIITGLLIEGGMNLSELSTKLLLSCFLLGILFFSIFYAMGYASAKIGIGVSSASAKLSLLIPVLYSALVLKEPFGPLRVLAILIIIPAIMLMTYRKGEKQKFSDFIIPFLIFIGSGVIDTSLNILQSQMHDEKATSITLIFSGALLSSLIISLKRKISFIQNVRSISFGFILGVPNYFSIYCLVLALSSGLFSSAEFYMLNNTGIMLLSFTLAAVMFKEKLDFKKTAGIILSIISIYLILFN